MIVKKRCSVKSVSSYGSNWIRWLTVQDIVEMYEQLQYTWTTTSKNGEKMRRGTIYFDSDDVSQLSTGYVATQTKSIQKYSFLKTLWYVYCLWQKCFFASFHAVSKPVTPPNHTGHLSLVTWNLIQVFFSGFIFNFQRRLTELVCACSTKSFK